MNSEEMIEKVYKVHLGSGLYDETFENVIFKLTNSYDAYFLFMYRDAIYGRSKSEEIDEDFYDQLRHSYRACIKFAYEDCKPGAFNQKITLLDIKKYQDELKETVNFNLIRNTIDRYKLGKYSVKYDENQLIFENVKDVRDMIYDFYSRNFADKIPGGKNDNDTIDVISINVEIAKLARKKQEFQSKKIYKPAKHVLVPLIYDLVQYFLKDSDLEIGLLKGNEYYLGEYLLAYCYIVAIGMFKTAYLLSLKGDSDLINQPSILYPKDRLISDIVETVEISKDSARKVIEDMTYNYEFHKDRVTIYQPLFEVGNYLLCSSYLVFHSYALDKVMKYFDVKGINKQDLTIYHKYKSDQMNHRMASNLPQMYSNLRTFENCILDFGSIRKAEVDIVLFDTENKQAVLVELKNYTPVDNEIDALTKEKRINNAIESRLEKDNRVLENLELFFKQNNLPIEYIKYDFASLLVTNSYTGGVGVKEKIKVIDEALFYNLLDIYRGNVLELLTSLDKGTFFKELKQVVSIKDQHYSYKGINVVVSNKN